MNSKLLTTLVILVVILAIGGIYYYNSFSPENKNMMSDEESMMEDTEHMTSEDDAMTEDSGSTMMGDLEFAGQVLAGDKSPLLNFNESDYQKALETDKLIVLYFYANWCPICRVEFPKMQSAFNSLAGDEVVAFRVNYNDNETDSFEESLAREFGVAYQHTKVFVKNGERVLKSPESWNKDRYLAEIEKFLTK